MPQSAQAPGPRTAKLARVDRAAVRRSAFVLALGVIVALIVRSKIPFCPLAGAFGIPCPGCGLTRATLALARGDVQHAFALHPLVFVLGPLFIAGTAHAAYSYVRGPKAYVREPSAPQKPSAWRRRPH